MTELSKNEVISKQLHHFRHLDVCVKDLELFDDFADPLLDSGHVDVDAQRQVEFVVNGVDMPELFEEHRPLHVPELPVRRLDVGMVVPIV